MACVVVLCAVAACARPKPAATSPQRIQGSPPEQQAALRAATRLQSEDEEARWGIEGQMERERQKREAASGARVAGSAVIPMPPPNDAGGYARGDGGADRL